MQPGHRRGPARLPAEPDPLQGNPVPVQRLLAERTYLPDRAPRAEVARGRSATTTDPRSGPLPGDAQVPGSGNIGDGGEVGRAQVSDGGPASHYRFRDGYCCYRCSRSSSRWIARSTACEHAQVTKAITSTSH